MIIPNHSVLKMILSRILFWAVFWASFDLIYFTLSLGIAISIGMFFGFPSLTASEILSGGIEQLLVSAPLGMVGGLIWIALRGERFGNTGSFFYWGIFWMIPNLIVTVIMLLTSSLFGFNISFDIFRGIAGIIGKSREKRFLPQ